VKIVAGINNQDSNNSSITSATSKYLKTYTSYSGHDMVVIFEIPLVGGSYITKVIGMCQTISYSIHNEKFPVRVLGDMNLKSYVFGNRTVAGSMVLTVFDKHWSNDMVEQYLAATGASGHVLDDELPPINITISMSNEYGDTSRLAIYGVSFVNEGQVMSVNDVYTENTYEFFAKDVDYLTTNVNSNKAEASRNKAVNNKINNLNDNQQDTTDVDNPKKTDNGSNKKTDNKEDEKKKNHQEQLDVLIRSMDASERLKSYGYDYAKEYLDGLYKDNIVFYKDNLAKDVDSKQQKYELNQLKEKYMASCAELNNEFKKPAEGDNA
jgi:hypothetical protein